jgi:hypothetical protein
MPYLSLGASSITTSEITTSDMMTFGTGLCRKSSGTPLWRLSHRAGDVRLRPFRTVVLHGPRPHIVASRVFRADRLGSGDDREIVQYPGQGDLK